MTYSTVQPVTDRTVELLHDLSYSVKNFFQIYFVIARCGFLMPVILYKYLFETWPPEMFQFEILSGLAALELLIFQDLTAEALLLP